MMGCSRGKTTSLSISINEAADGGGIGDTLRKIPIYNEKGLVNLFVDLTLVALPAASTLNVSVRGSGFFAWSSPSFSALAMESRQVI